uniref:Uncharacterized protein n=1 Tax=Anguilla anguilla TaxID=7936 RepID=A0A0E9X5X0_ANGAN
MQLVYSVVGKCTNSTHLPPIEYATCILSSKQVRQFGHGYGTNFKAENQCNVSLPALRLERGVVRLSPAPPQTCPFDTTFIPKPKHRQTV